LLRLLLLPLLAAPARRQRGPQRDQALQLVAIGSSCCSVRQLQRLLQARLPLLLEPLRLGEGGQVVLLVTAGACGLGRRAEGAPRAKLRLLVPAGAGCGRRRRQESGGVRLQQAAGQGHQVVLCMPAGLLLGQPPQLLLLLPGELAAAAAGCALAAAARRGLLAAARAGRAVVRREGRRVQRALQAEGSGSSAGAVVVTAVRGALVGLGLGLGLGPGGLAAAATRPARAARLLLVHAHLLLQLLQLLLEALLVAQPAAAAAVTLRRLRGGRGGAARLREPEALRHVDVREAC
jgi:hypothetical protein